MAKKEAADRHRPKKTAAPPASQAQKSSVLKSAFAPSAFQLELFASVIQGFDSQHLRIHNFKDGRLHSDYGFGAGTRINSLNWGYYGTAFHNQQGQESGKKRKREHDTEASISVNVKNAVVALGTSASDVQMFSPAEGSVIGKLSGVHERGVNDFRFSTLDCLWGWSIGEDGKLAQWDLKVDKAVRTIFIPDMNIHILGPLDQQLHHQVLCASSTPYALGFNSSLDSDSVQPSSTITFDSFKQPIKKILRSGKRKLDDDEYFLAVDSDRYINIFSILQKRLVRTLVASSGVKTLSLLDHTFAQQRSLTEQQLLAVTQDGLIEIFSQPFMDLSGSGAGASMKAQRKRLTRKANATLKITRPGSIGSLVPVFDASFQESNIVFVWAEGGVNLSFEKMKWRDDHSPELLFSGSKEVVAAGKKSTFASGAKVEGNDSRKLHVDESHAVIVNGGAVGQNLQEAALALLNDEAQEANITDEESASENDEGKKEEENDGETREPPAAQSAAPVNGLDVSSAFDGANVGMNAPRQPPASGKAEESVDIAEPSFGDLLAAKSTDAISIAEATNAVGPAPTEATNQVALHSGISLSTVLTQALRTNDNNLLESCFHNTDTQIIRSTIQRLDSSLAGVLIQKLAERLSSRPGRYGHLLIWVQWICVAHGGAIGGRPDVLSKVKTLYKVLDQRSKALDSLLLLKGKLDMLDAQLGLRKQLLADRRADSNSEKGHVVYVEGEENGYSSDEDVATGEDSTVTPSISKIREKKALRELVPADEDESEDGEDMPMTNGVAAESGASDYDSEDEEGPIPQSGGGVVDEEAEESDEDSHPGDRDETDSEEGHGSGEDRDEDSEMDDFIDDGSMEEAESTSVISIDKTPEKP